MELASTASVDRALGAVLAAARDHWTANEAAAREGSDVEGVHQVRVGLRRFRSALSLFKAYLPSDQRAWMSGEAQWVLGELGMARDLDAFMVDVLAPLRARRGLGSAVALLEEAAQKSRAAVQRRVCAVLDSRRYARFLGRLDAWLSGEGWRASRSVGAKNSDGALAKDFARKALNKRLGKILARGPRLDRRPIEELHRLRIAIKKVRYNIDGMQSVLDRRRVAKLAAALKTLQDDLGHLNDLAMAETMLPQLVAQAPEPRRVALKACGGRVIAHYRRLAATALPALNRHWATFRKLDLL